MKIKYANLVNIILDKLIVPELIQDDCTPLKITQTAMALIRDDNRQKEQLELCKKALMGLSDDEQQPSVKASEIILSKINCFAKQY